MTSLISLPNRPLGTDIPSIEAVLSDFDTITNTVNDPVISEPRLILSAGGTFDWNNMPQSGSNDYFLPMGGYSAGTSRSGIHITVSNMFTPQWAVDSNSPTDFELPGTTAKVKLRGVVTCNTIDPGVTELVTVKFATAVQLNNNPNVIDYSLSTSAVMYQWSPIKVLSPSTIVTFESGEGLLPTDPSFSRVDWGLCVTMGPASISQSTEITVGAQVYAYNS